MLGTKHLTAITINKSMPLYCTEFIQGYMSHRAYIATQIPMENTVNNFWKMIWEYQSKSIVMLCKMTEDREVSCFIMFNLSEHFSFHHPQWS